MAAAPGVEVTARRLFSYGKGYLGSLGHGTFENYAQPIMVEALANVAFQSISSGWYESAFVVEVW